MKSISLLFILFMCLFGSALAGNISAEADRGEIVAANDTSSVQIRHVSNADIRSFKNDPEFDYQEKPSQAGLLQRFIRWLSHLLHIDQADVTRTLTNEYLWYGLFVLVLIFVVYRIFRSEIKGFFYGSGAVPIEISALEEDINVIDFDKLIQEAIDKNNFRYALRLFYLKSLKTLNDKELIRWKIDKTNHDYLEELKGSEIQPAFRSLTGLFNWIWYGDFPLTEADFQEARQEFTQFNNKLSAEI